MSRFSFLLACLVLNSFALGCGRIGYDVDGGNTLDVQLVTGLVPGAEFASVETTVMASNDDSRDGRVLASAEAVARLRTNYGEGHRVASFQVRSGSYLVRVRLRRPDGTLLIEQHRHLAVQSNYVLRVHVTRDCVGVQCPTAAGASFIGCLNGQCVDPRCTEETPAFCPETRFCLDASECRATSACATTACDEGICTQQSIEGACDDNAWCNPDTGAGCQPFDPESADTRCGTICNVPGQPCQVGYFDCTDPTDIHCEPLFHRVAGASCGSSSFCDVAGSCVACPSGASCTIGCALGSVECVAGIASCVLHDPAEYASAGSTCLDDGTCIAGDPCTTNGACNGEGFCDVTGDGPPGIVISPLLGLTTTESGGTASVMVRLASIPRATVQVSTTSTDGTEGTITGGGILLFTPENWNGVQTVTATGADDALADGNQSYGMHFVTSSSDAMYIGLSIPDVPILNVDNESSGITITPTSGLVTDEAGSTATFTVLLNTMPSDDVVIHLASDTPSEGVATPTVLTFTPLNWNAPQLVTVAGVDDPFADGSQPYIVVTDSATSSDTNYNGIDPSDVAVTNNDDESPAILASPLAGLLTTEAGGEASFTISLTSHPLTDVVIDVSSSDVGEGIVSPASVTFTSDNWDSLQTITVTGVDDDIIDGAQAYTLRVAPNPSSDASYASLPMVLVDAQNTDDETAGIIVTPTTGLTTTESGGTTTFSIVLASSPSASVIIGLSSSDLTEGSVSPASVTFTSLNWNAPRTITVTGVNDAAADGNQPYTIVTAAAISGDSNYVALDSANVDVINIDDDSAGIAVAPTSGLTTTEAGGTATFTVRLNTMPTASVVIGLSSSDTTEGVIAPASLTFTTGNWASPQTVTLTGVDDLVADGTQSYQALTGAATSTDLNYNGVDALNVSATNSDNDSPGVLVSSVGPPGYTTEAGGTVTFNVRLQSQPTASVGMGVSSTDLTEATVSPASLTFTTVDWSTPHVVTVTGVDDLLLDGNQPFTVALAATTSSDVGYVGINPADVALLNYDNDTPGFTIAPASVQVTEGGGTATFSITLTAQPSADVVLGLTASDLTEATVGPASITFTPLDWNTPHVVTVTGVDDSSADGNQASNIVTGAVSSADVRFNGANPADVPVTTLDDDIPRIVNLTTDGTQVSVAYTYSYAPSMSYDGRYIAFTSAASNIVLGDTNNSLDVFVRDMIANTVERVSLGDDESQGNNNSLSPTISSDGRFVAFMSQSTNWIVGATNESLVYVRDRMMGTTTLASAVNGTYTLPGPNFYGARGAGMSLDGRYVAFVSASDNILGGAPHGWGQQLYVRDMQTLATTIESVGTGGVLPTNHASGYGNFDFDRTMSADGRFLVFSSASPGFFMGDDLNSYDVFLRDRVMDITTQINVTPMGAPSSGEASWPQITPDGRYVLFESNAADIVAGDVSTRTDVFVRDTMTATTICATRSTAGSFANNNSDQHASMSDDARYVVFGNYGSNLVPGDTNMTEDVFVRDTQLNTTLRVSVGPGGVQLFGQSAFPTISGDGRYVAFGSSSTMIVPGDMNAVSDLFVVPRP